jgi:hypothetical protein
MLTAVITTISTMKMVAETAIFLAVDGFDDLRAGLLLSIGP